MPIKNQFSITAEDVEQISTILDGSAFDTFELTTTHFTLRVAKSTSGSGMTQEWKHDSALDEVTLNNEPAVVEKKRVTLEKAEGLSEVLAPLPGTFYRSPKPGAPAFIETGTVVRDDTAIAIIETMKLMNSVYAGGEGKVVEICVEDGEMVDKGDVLIRVRPTSEESHD